ncbi:MAG: hypothetical protein GX442_25205 [Candidatus Riflebacteria bacterium]|nr:hypothetical protein [Candidatus Riflebacteria bacterium]
MSKTNSLDELRKALTQSNRALQKRALAIIHNEVVIEAQGLLQEFLGTQPEPDLQVLTMKVLKKLQEFASLPTQATPETLIPLLQSADESRRLYALRALRQRCSTNLLYTVQQFGADLARPEARVLVAEIFRRNPDLGNLPILLSYLGDAAATVRQEAFQAIIAVFQGCLLPHLLRGLADPAPGIVYLVRQFLNQVGKEHLLAALQGMLAGEDPAQARLAAGVLAGLPGADVIPLARDHLAHPDPATAARVKEIVQELARKGDPDAAALIPPPPPEEETATVALRDLESRLLEVWPKTPAWLLEPLAETGRSQSPLAEVNTRLRTIFERVRHLLVSGFIAAYFAQGGRNRVADRACFRAVADPTGLNTLQLMRLLADTLPDPYGFGDIFPLAMGHCFREGLEDEFAEPFISLQEGFNLLDEYPQETANFHVAAVEGLCDLLRGLSRFLGSNHLVVKQGTPDGLRVLDLWGPKPSHLDPKLFSNDLLPVNCPMLFSQDSMNRLPLVPFFQADQATGLLRRGPMDEKARWEFFERVEAQESFLLFLTETGAGT